MSFEAGLGAHGPTPVVKETLLSRSPARGSAAVAAATVAGALALSLVYWLDPDGWGRWLPASRAAVLGRGEYWRAWTTMGVHADVEHFLSNGIVLGLLSLLLYGYFGPRVHPGGTIGLGGVVTLVALSTYPFDTVLVGASGLVYLMAGFWLTNYLLLERRLPPVKRSVRAVGFALVVLVPSALEPQVSYRTHAIGFLVGIAFGIGYFRAHRDELRRAERVVWEEA